MLKTIDLDEYIGLCKSSIPKELVTVDWTGELYENQIVGDPENGVFLMVSPDKNYTLLGGAERYVEKDYLKSATMVAITARYEPNFSEKL